MKKLGLLSLGLLTLVALVSCVKTGPTPEKVKEGFNPELTTLTATYDADYEMVVNSDNQSMKNFERNIDMTTTIEADYTAGQLYLFAKKVNADNSFVEVLLYNDNGTYKYVTSTMADVVDLENETAARAKMDELLKETTYAEAGWVSEKSFVYSDNYAHNQYLMDSTNVTVDMVEAPTLSVNDNKGITAAYALKYIAYVGDSGVFEFNGTNTAVVDTTSLGLVTSATINMNAHLDMAIVNPPIPLDLAGTRTLTVNHGATLTKKDSIEHSAPMVDVKLAETTNGTYAVKWFDYDHGSYAMNDLVNGQAQVGMWLGVTVQPAEGYKVEYVKVNGATTQVVVQGIYCFKVDNKEQKVEVTFVEENVEVATEAVVIFEQPEHATLKVTYLDFNDGGAAAPQTQLNSGDSFTVDKTSYWLAFEVTPEEGYELDQITINGTPAVNYGTWLYSVKTAGEYVVVATVKSTGSAPVEKEEATVTYSAAENGTFQVVSFTMGAFENMPEVENGGKVEVGMWIGVKCTPAEGYVVDTVTVNGNPTNLQFGYYCYSVKDTTALEVVVTYKAAQVEVVEAVVTYAAAENGTYTVSWFDFDNGSFAMTAVESGSKVQAGMWLAVKCTAAEGYEVESVKVNGTDAQFQSGFYCYKVVDATALEIVVAYKALPVEELNATISIQTPENGSVVVKYLDFALGVTAPQTEVVDGGQINLNSGAQLFLVIYPTAAEGYELESIKVNGTQAMFQNVWVSALNKEVLEYEVVVTFKKIPAPAPEMPENAVEVAITGTNINSGAKYEFSNENKTVTLGQIYSSTSQWGRWNFSTTESYAKVVAVFKGTAGLQLVVKVDDSGNSFDGKNGNKKYVTLTEEYTVLEWDLASLGMNSKNLVKLVFYAYDSKQVLTAAEFTLEQFYFVPAEEVETPEVPAPEMPENAVAANVTGSSTGGSSIVITGNQLVASTYGTSANQWGRWDITAPGAKYAKAVVVLKGTGLSVCTRLDNSSNKYNQESYKKYVRLEGEYTVIEWDLEKLNIDSTDLVKVIFMPFDKTGETTSGSFELVQFYFIPAEEVETPEVPTAKEPKTVAVTAVAQEASIYTFSEDKLTVTSSNLGTNATKWGRWNYTAVTEQYKYVTVVIRSTNDMAIGIKVDGDGNPYDKTEGNKLYKAVKVGTDLVITYDLEAMGMDATKLNKVVFYAYNPDGSGAGEFTLVSVTYHDTALNA